MMKIEGLIISAVLGSISFTLQAQDAAPASVDLYSGQQQPEVTSPTPPEETAPDLPELSELDEAFKQKSLGKQVDARRLHIEWRQLKNQVANDPQIKAAEAATRSVHTDLEKRQRLRDYYNIYYDRMSALTSSADIKLGLQMLKAAHLATLAQPRVRPSADTPLPTPAPTPQQKHKHRKHPY
jgi:hypothetical protein